MRTAIISFFMVFFLIQTASAFLIPLPTAHIPNHQVTSVDYQPPSGKVIVEVIHNVDDPVNVTGVIYYGTQSLNYKISYVRPNFYTSRIYLELGNENTTIENYDILGLPKTVVIKLSVNNTGTVFMSLYYDSGQLFKPGVGVVVQNAAYSPINRIVLASTKEIDVEIGIVGYNEYLQGLEETINEATGNYTNIYTIWNLLEFAHGSFVIISGVVYYFKLIFIDNGLLTFALFEAFTLAWSAGTSRNIWSFYRKYINVHRSLFEFLINLIERVVSIFYKIIQAIKPI